MKIGFEAKRAFYNDTGLGHYSRTLIRSLAAGFPQHEYFLFTPGKGRIFTGYESANVSVVEPMRPLDKLFKSAWRSSRVTNDIRRLGIDLYHGLSHEIPVGIHKTGAASVVTMHDLIHERYPEQYKAIDRRIYTQKFQYACQHANRVIAISEQTRRDLIEIYQADPEKIDVCYQACNPAFGVMADEATRERIRLKYDLPEKYLLSVGSIIERKNLLNVCKALALLGNNMELPLVVIGKGGGYYKQVQQFIKEKGLEQKVIFLSYRPEGGYVADADLPAVYQMAEMLLYPSFFEGFGIPVLEGLWSRVPVITSNISCLPEAGGDAAFYVDPSSEQQIADAIMQVLQEPTLVAAQVQKGLAHAQKFTTEACAAAVMQSYQKALS